MLYLDSSALIKRYQNEQGTETLNIRLREEAKGLRSVFTSVLTYAEIHAAFARRAREKLLSPKEAAAVQDEFDADWALSISPIELGTGVLAFVRDLVREFPLRGADAILRQEISHGVGARQRQLLVVSDRSHVVGVAFHFDLVIPMLLKQFSQP